MRRLRWLPSVMAIEGGEENATEAPVDGVIRTYGLFEKLEWRKDTGL